MFSSGMITVLSHMAMALYVIGWMFRISWSLGLVSFAALIAMAAFAAWFRRIARPAFRHFRERVAAITRKSDRLPPVGETNAARHVIRVSTTGRVGCTLKRLAQGQPESPESPPARAGWVARDGALPD